jgi:hypothetical protein
MPLLLVLLLIAVLPPRAIQAQSERTDAVTGRVVDAEHGTPLLGANVIIDGTTWGAATDSSGRFQLPPIPDGTYTLAASMVGYRMVERVLELPAMAGQPLRIELTPAPIELEGVTVDGDRGTWLAHLETFRTLFLGTTPNATACTLLNPEVLSFVARGDSVFRATASGPLRVENRALGYRVDFYIDRFAARGPLDRHQLAR